MKKFRTKSAVALVMVLTLLTSLFSTSAFAVTDPLVDPTRDVTLTVHKYDVPEDGTGLFPLIGNDNTHDSTELTPAPSKYAPMKDATFAAYLVTDSNKKELEKLANTTTIPNATYTAVESVTTGTDGTAVFNNLSQARYLIVEVSSPKHVTKKAVNFLVDLPYTNKDLTTWNYNVHVYPKNYTVLGAVELTKTIQGAPMAAGKSATFKLQQLEAGVYVDVPGMTALTTDADGKIKVTDLLVGLYQFIETVAPEGYGINTNPIPFQITKNASVKIEKVSMDNNSLPEIEKEVSDDGINFGSAVGVFANKPATWKITPDVPTDIATYSKFIVTDKVDDRLILDNASIKVLADGATLVKDTDYQVSVVNNLITVTFIDGAFVAGQTALNGVSELNILFNTTIDLTKADSLATDIPNDTTLTFNNGYGTDTDVKSTESIVYTGGVKFEKVDAADTSKKLENAEFAIYASEADAIAGVNAISTAISDVNGAFEFTGLAYGTLNETSALGTPRDYWIVETKAPADYHLNKTPLMVTIDANSYDVVNTIQVKNVEKPDLPLTGGQGAMLFTVIGLALIGLAAVLFNRYRKVKAN